MMRQPTSFTEAFAWHRSALRGASVERFDGLPEVGWFKMQRVKGGPFVPVRIFIESQIDPDTGELTAPERYVAEVEGIRADPVPIWTYLTPISRADFDALVERHRSDDVMAATMVALDLSKTPTLPPRRKP